MQLQGILNWSTAWNYLLLLFITEIGHFPTGQSSYQTIPLQSKQKCNYFTSKAINNK